MKKRLLKSSNETGSEVVGIFTRKSLIRKFRKGVQFFLIFVIVVLTATRINGQQGPLKISETFQAKIFFSSTVDSDNKLWFLTEAGIVNFDGKQWSLHNQNPAIPTEGLKDIKYNSTPSGGELLIATSNGVKVAALPLDANSKVDTYLKDNSQIISQNILSATGKGSLRWFGTDKGVSALQDGKWLTNSYEGYYPPTIFEDFPINSMATSPSGDTLYAATSGAGVIRLYRNDVDAVSGASEYAEWGPIIMPSDNVLCIYIAPDGTQWLGTDKGIAKHTGYETLENWDVYNTEDGLAGNEVQVINSDKKGNIWFGTKNGVSMFDGSKWTSYRVEEGLVSNNILSITIDTNDVVWLGTDNGVTSISDDKITSYQ